MVGCVKIFKIEQYKNDFFSKTEGLSKEIEQIAKKEEGLVDFYCRDFLFKIRPSIIVDDWEEKIKILKSLGYSFVIENYISFGIHNREYKLKAYRLNILIEEYSFSISEKLCKKDDTHYIFYMNGEKHGN
ncbi:MAG: hypothetical protein KAS07_05995 [Candidatus Pacebacteria bacterium]|nr:hypothetical protein [Candidatus Paceibacterota bacterium]